MAGRAVILLGAPCAGKTTLAKAFQDRAPRHVQRLSMDGFFAGVADRWAGGPVGIHRDEGFVYVRDRAPGGRETLRIEYGEVGWRILQGMHASVVGFVEAGNDVVFDDMPLDADALLDWRRALAGIEASAVLLDVPLEVLERREAGRDPSMHGLARGHVDLFTDVSDVDLRLDGTRPPEVLVGQLQDHLAQRGRRTTGVTLALH